MTPPEQFAAMRAIYHGLGNYLTTAARNVVTFRKLTGSRSFDTPFGSVTFVLGEPAMILPPAELLAWAQSEMPHEVIPEHQELVPASVRPSLIKTLKGEKGKPGRFRIVRDSVIDTKTGEVVEWAKVEPAGEDTVRMSLTSEAKAEAEALVAERAASIAALVAPEIEGVA